MVIIKFEYTTKWYMHKSESVRENETHKIPLHFEIRTDHLISIRNPVILIIKKKVDFAVLVDHRGKIKESEKIDRYLDLARGLK